MSVQPTFSSGEPILRVAAQLEYADGTTRTITASSDTTVEVAAVDGSAFTKAEAAQLTGRIQQGMDHVQALVVEGFVGRIWLALGLRTWDEWADMYFGDRPMLAFSREDRPALVASLSDAGLSTRAIQAATGLGKSTVARELSSGVPNGTPDSAGQGVGRRDKVAGVDGKDYHRPTPKPKPEIAECEICGEANADCHGGETCTEYERYANKERPKLPPGPPMPPLPRDRSRKPLAENTSDGSEVVYSNGKGVSLGDSSALDEATDWSELPLCEATDLTLDLSDDDRIFLEEMTQARTVFDQVTAEVTVGMGNLPKDVGRLKSAMRSWPADRLGKLDPHLVVDLRGVRDHLALLMEQMPGVLTDLDTILAGIDGSTQ